MRKIFVCGLIAASLFAATASWAQSNTQSSTFSPYSQYGLGVLADQSQSFNRGMSGTGIAMRNGTLVNTLNPASYSAVDSLTMLFDAGLSGQFTNFKEGNTSVNASKGTFDYVVGLFRIRRHFGVSFGLLPFSDVGYNYTTSTYLNTTIGRITETFDGKGGLHQAFIGAGWNPVKPLSIGFNFGYLWGSYTRSASSSGTITVNSLSKTYKATVSNYNLTLGMQWQQPLGKKDRVTLGATWGLGHKLNADPTCDIINMNTSTMVSDTTSFTIKNGLELPTTIGAGLAWEHKNKLTVAADFTMQQWGKVSYPNYDETSKTYILRDGLLTDRTRVSVGADYVPDAASRRNYLKRVHYRIGAAYVTPYYKINGQDGPKEMSVSAGLGLPLQNAWNNRSVLNISAQWVHSSAKDLITDNTFRISVGVTFNEKWFDKWRID